MPGMPASFAALAQRSQEATASAFSICVGVVFVENGKTSHWELTDEQNIIVSVRLRRGLVPIWALVSDIGGLRIPDVGTEVVVGHDGGVEGVGVILGTVPKVTQAIATEAATKRLIIDNEVWVYDGTGTPVALALKSDVQAVKDAIAGAPTTANDGGLTLQTGIVEALSGYPEGTSILKGK